MRYVTFMFCLMLLLGACGGGDNAGPAAAGKGHAPVRETPTGPGDDDLRQARNLFEKARDASAAHDNTRAEEYLRRAVEIDSEYGLAHAWLGRVLHDLGRYDEALNHHLRAAELADEPGLRREQRHEASLDCFAMADKALRSGEYVAAERHVRQAMELGRESHAGLMRLGHALRHQQKLKEAEEAYRRAAGMVAGRQSHEARFEAGKVQHLREDYQGAVETFSELIREDYTGQDIYAWRGYCRYLLDDLENALHDYTKAQRYATSDENAREYAELEGKLVRMLYSDD